MVEATFRVTRRKSEVKLYLTDPSKFVSVHPLIYRMDRLPDNTFRVFEKTYFARIPYKFTYKAKIAENGDQVLIDANVMGMTKISMVFEFQDGGQGATLVKEFLSVKSFLPIAGFLGRFILEQHREMFDTIENAIDLHQ